MISLQETPIEQLTQFLRHCREINLDPILWVGAGMSAAAGYPTLSGVEMRLREWLPGIEKSGFDLIDAYVEKYSEANLAALLQRIFSPARQVGPIHRSIARLAGAGVCPILFTTNYDRLLETALAEEGVPFLSQTLEANFKLQSLKGVQLLKMHGDEGDWLSIVLTSESYKMFRDTYPLLTEQLDLNLRSRPILFLGCSLMDERLLSWLKELPEAKRRQLFASRAVLTEEEWARLPSKHKELLRSSRIQPILVRDHASITWLFEEIVKQFISLDPDELIFELEPGEGLWKTIGPTRESPQHEALNPLRDSKLLSLLSELQDKTREPIPIDPETTDAQDTLLHLAQQIGNMLATVLLAAPAQEAMRRRFNQIHRGRARLTIRVRDETPLGHQALTLPWELLTLAGRFPVRDGDLDIVRETIAEGGPTLPEPANPLSVAVTIAAPEDQPGLHYEEEAFRLQRALAPLGQTVAFAELGKVTDLVEVVRGQRAAVVHFSGPALPDELIFENDLGLSHRVTVDNLIARLKQAMPKADEFPRLFFLAACCQPKEPDLEADGNDDLNTIIERMPSTAAVLHRRGFIEVVSYSGILEDELRTEAESVFYQALARGQATLQAVALARTVLDTPIEKDGTRVCYPLGWAQLRVYLRGPDRPLALPAEGTDDLPARFERQKIRISGLPVLRVGFIGRRALQHKIRRRFEKGQRLFVLQGLGGLGKTALASQLISRVFARDPRDQLILRCQVFAEALLRDPIEALRTQVEEHGRLHAFPSWEDEVQKLRQAYPEAVEGFVQVVDMLRGIRPHLVIYADNAETLQEGPKSEVSRAMGSWKPEAISWWRAMEALSQKGLVLASTRYTWEELSRNPRAWIEIEPMRTSEILRMILSFPTLQSLQAETRLRLAEKIDGHPRTVEFLDDLIAGQRSKLGLGASITDEWRQLVEPVLNERAEKITSDLLLENIWERLSPEAISHAKAVSVLASHGPMPVIETLGSAREELIRTSLLTLYPQQIHTGNGVEWQDQWGLHSLVREFIAAKMTEEERHRCHMAAAMAYLTLQNSEDALPHDRAMAQSGVIIHLSLAGELAQAWSAVEEFVKGVRKGGSYEAIDKWPENLGTDADTMAVAFIIIAQMLGQGHKKPDQNSWDAEFLLDEAFNMSKDEVRGFILHAKAWRALNREEPKVAEDLLRRALTLREKAVGLVHPDYTTSLLALTRLLRLQGRSEEAQILLDESLLMLREAALRVEDAKLCGDLAQLAALFASEGRFSDGEVVLQHALNIFDDPSRPDYVQLLVSFAVIQYKLERDEAEDTTIKALNGLNEKFGPDDPTTKEFAPRLRENIKMLAFKRSFAEARAAAACEDYESAIIAQKRVAEFLRESAEGADHQTQEMLRFILHDLREYCDRAHLYNEMIGALEEIVRIDEAIGHKDLEEDLCFLETARLISPCLPITNMEDFLGGVANNLRARVIEALTQDTELRQLSLILERAFVPWFSEAEPSPQLKDFGQYVIAVVALLRGEPVPEVESRFAEYLADIQRLER